MSPGESGGEKFSDLMGADAKGYPIRFHLNVKVLVTKVVSSNMVGRDDDDWGRTA